MIASISNRSCVRRGRLWLEGNCLALHNLRSAAAVIILLSLAACSVLPGYSESTLMKAKGSLVVPAGSPVSACVARVVAENQETLFVSEAERKLLAAGITAATVTELSDVPAQDSRALYRHPDGSVDAAVSAKVVQSANAALEVLSSPTQQKLLALMALGSSPSVGREFSPILASGAEGPPTLKINRQEWADYTNALATVSLTDGWTALSVHFENQLRSLPTSDPTRATVTGLQRESRLISTYVAAYFREGKFVSVTIDPSKFDTELQTKVNAWLKDAGGSGATASTGNLVGTVANDVLPSQCKASAPGSPLPSSCTLLGSIGQTGFLTRSGDKYAFPALTLQVDPLGQQKLTKPQVDVKNVIGDLVRVVLEATGDAFYAVPASPGSTACAAGLLPCYDPSTAKVSADNFAKVNQYAAESETVASGGVGLLIRGGFWVALNNENLATAVETGVGVAARKTAERVAWDYLSCTKAPGDFRAVAVTGAAYRTINVTIQ